MTNCLDGIFLLDKPTGLSSHTAMRRAQRLLEAKKAGHTGSLDPLATGMLPICLGEATKFSRFFLEAKKAYAVTVCWGVTTTTGDSEGEICATAAVPDITADTLADLEQHFTGEQWQVPPMFSALKYQGKPLYRLARAGKTVERAPRRIHIDCLTFQSTTDFTMECSKGTYVRSLVEAMGERIGCGAHVTALRRCWVDPFQASSILTLEGLEALAKEERMTRLLSVSSILAAWIPALVLLPEAGRAIQQGKTVSCDTSCPLGRVRLFCEERFLGIGDIMEAGRVRPERLINVI